MNSSESLVPSFSSQSFNSEMQNDFACQMETVAELNSRGVQLMECCSEFSEAATFFYRSMNIMGVSEFALAHPKAFLQVKSEGRNRPTKSDLYDEGMSALSEPVKINPVNPSIAMSIATILFNVGVLNLRRNEDEESLYCFSQALFIANQARAYFPVTIDNKRKGELDIVTILHNIGYVQYRSGSYEDAIETYNRIVQILKESTNPSSSSMFYLAAILNCLGLFHYHASESDTQISMDIYLESLTLHRAVIGKDVDNKAVATVLNNIGRVYYRRGEFEKAIEMYSHSLSMRRQLFGDEHLDVAATICNIGQAYHQNENLNEALESYKEFIMMAKKVLGYIHRDVAVTLKCMAQIHTKLGDYKRAFSFYKESIFVGKAALGPYHEEIASTLNQLGSLYNRQGDFDRAMSTYMEGLEVERRVFGTVHPNVAITLSNIGGIYMHHNAYHAALSFYNDAFLIQCRTLGKSHPKTATSLSCIGMILFRTGCYQMAIDAYRKVLSILCKIHGEDHLEVALTLNSIGLAFCKMHLCKDALRYFEDSLRIRRTLLGKNHHSLAVILFNIGSLHLELGEDDDAIAYYHEALDVERSNVQQKGINKSKTHLSILGHVARMHQKRGELGEAIKYLSEKLRMLLNADQQDVSLIVETLNSLGSLYLQTGQTAKLVDVMSNASRYLRCTGKNAYELDLSGFGLYSITKCHPECAAVA